MRRHTEFTGRMAFRLAVVLAAIACALLWAGLPAPAGAQSTETGVSGVTVDGNPAFRYGSIDWTYSVSAATTQATVVVRPVDDNATTCMFEIADADDSTAGHQVNLSSGSFFVFAFTVTGRETARNSAEQPLHHLSR